MSWAGGRDDGRSGAGWRDDWAGWRDDRHSGSWSGNWEDQSWGQGQSSDRGRRWGRGDGLKDGAGGGKGAQKGAEDSARGSRWRRDAGRQGYSGDNAGASDNGPWPDAQRAWRGEDRPSRPSGYDGSDSHAASGGWGKGDQIHKGAQKGDKGGGKGDGKGDGKGKGKGKGRGEDDATSAPAGALGPAKGSPQLGAKGGSKGEAKGEAKGDGKGDGKGKGKGKPKKTPEERGFVMSDGGVYLRPAQLRNAMPARPLIEVGNLEKAPAGPLERGFADVEVLCNRQSVLGNPFNMTQKRAPGEEKPRGPPAKNEALRDPVCDAYEAFFEACLKAGASGPLLDKAFEGARRVGLPDSVVGPDWKKDFGSRTVEEFCAAFEAIQALVEERRGGDRGVRLLCHCVPLRCHCLAIASRLA